MISHYEKERATEEYIVAMTFVPQFNNNKIVFYGGSPHVEHNKDIFNHAARGMFMVPKALTTEETKARQDASDFIYEMIETEMKKRKSLYGAQHPGIEMTLREIVPGALHVSVINPELDGEKTLVWGL